MIFDPVLDSAVLGDDTEIIQRDMFNQPIICAHCYKTIKGKYYQSGKNYYDKYCWQFRFVIDPLYIERASRKKVKDFDEEGNEI
jgi:hypothetical protein